MQGDLFDDMPELRFWKNIITTSKKIAKSRLPHPLAGESKEDYYIALKDESKLELAFMLRKIADDIEKDTLKRQKTSIDFIYGGINGDKIR